MPIEFDSDLTIAVGDVEGRLVADGSALTVKTDDAVAFLRAARSTAPAGSKGVGTLAALLRDEGVGVAVRGARGESVALGAPVGQARDSGRLARLSGRLATGSPDVIIERPQAFFALAPTGVRYSVIAGAGALLALLVRAVVTRRRGTD